MGSKGWAGSLFFGDSLAAQPAGGGRDVRVVLPLESEARAPMAPMAPMGSGWWEGGR